MKHLSIGILAVAVSIGSAGCGATLVDPFRNSVEFRPSAQPTTSAAVLAPAPLAYVTPPAPAPSAYTSGGSIRASSER